MKYVLFIVIFGIFLSACGTANDKEKNKPSSHEIPVNQNTLQVGEDIVPYYACNMNKKSDHLYLLMMAGVTKSNKLVHLNLLVREKEGSYSLIDTDQGILWDGKDWNDLELKEIERGEDYFEVVIQGWKEIRANCKLEETEEYPKAKVNDIQLDAVSCSVFKADLDGITVSAFLMLDQERKIFLNHTKQGTFSYTSIGEFTKNNQSTTHKKLDAEVTYLDEVLKLSLFYEPFNRDYTYDIDLECEIGKNSKRGSN